jgi:hypothetical protein
LRDDVATLQWLALTGGAPAVAQVEAFAAKNPDQTALAIKALSLLRRDGGDATLVAWWHRPDVAPDVREELAYAIGVIAPDSTSSREILRQIIATPNARLRQRALHGLATGESYMDESLLPPDLTLSARPHSQWLTARLEVLDFIEPSAASPPAKEQIQKIRDELLADLERTQ